MSWMARNARFTVAGQAVDVFYEDYHMLLVWDEAFDYDGSFQCREYRKRKDGGYIVSDMAGASYRYVAELSTVMEDEARLVIIHDLMRTAQQARSYDEELADTYEAVAEEFGSHF